MAVESLFQWHGLNNGFYSKSGWHDLMETGIYEYMLIVKQGINLKQNINTKIKWH